MKINRRKSAREMIYTLCTFDILMVAFTEELRISGTHPPVGFSNVYNRILASLGDDSYE